jgi:SPP1 family predicted phage head-tail adaptor
MNLNNMTQRITIQEKRTVTDEFGSVIETWVEITTVWAELLIGFGREYWGAAKLNTELSGIIKIRYLPGLKIRNTRILYGERIFEVIAVIDPGERRRELELHVKEVI